MTSANPAPETPPADHRPQLPAHALAAGPVRLTSEELLKGGREILIVHCEEIYRLRVTRNGKLLLTK